MLKIIPFLQVLGMVIDWGKVPEDVTGEIKKFSYYFSLCLGALLVRHQAGGVAMKKIAAKCANLTT